MRLSGISLIACCSWLAAAVPGLAQRSTIAVSGLDPSIRSLAMGSAGSADLGGPPWVWGNPASLALARGVSWEQTSTILIPEIRADVMLRSQRLVFGGAGVGVSLMGKPISGLGETRLSYPVSGADIFGNPTGSTEGHELTESWAVGVSLLELFDAVASRFGRSTDHARFVDLALGLQRKHTELLFGPGFGAEADGLDWGGRARVTPLRPTEDGHGVGLDISVGHAVQNASDDTFTFAVSPSPATALRHYRTGAALHLAAPSRWGGDPRQGLAGAMRAGLRERYSAVVAYDHERITERSASGGTTIHRLGVEITAASVLSGRLGRVLSGRLGLITERNAEDAFTFGVGVRLPIGPWGDVRYDFAKISRMDGSGLSPTGHGWSVWMDPARIWRDRTKTM